MNDQKANAQMLTRLMFRLLPIQILLAAVGSVNGIVSSFFASNFVGVDAMSAVGLYSPVNMFFSAISLILVGGSVILCGKYMGQNQQDELQSTFSLNMILSVLITVVFSLLFLLLGLFDLTGFMTRDETVRPLFNRYLLGQTIGLVPLFLGNSFAAFLSLENKSRYTTIASILYILANIILNALFVQWLHLEAFGLALASSLGLWVFLAAELWPFLKGETHLRIRLRKPCWKEALLLYKTGLPGAAGNGYQTLRGYLVNRLLDAFVGSVGISAFAAANNLLSIFWSVPLGMMAVSRLLFSVSAGSFMPAPKVDSAVIRLDIRSTPPVDAPPEKFFRAVKAAFSQRRKVIANSLAAGLGVDKASALDILEKAGVSASARAEKLSLADFAAIAEQL